MLNRRDRFDPAKKKALSGRHTSSQREKYEQLTSSFVIVRRQSSDT